MMSWVDRSSYWKCPSCDCENEQRLTWQHWHKFKEIPDEVYSKEQCKHCGKEYYVSESEPKPWAFKLDKGKCKNIKDLVIDVNEKLTLIGEYLTT